MTQEGYFKLASANYNRDTHSYRIGPTGGTPPGEWEATSVVRRITQGITFSSPLAPPVPVNLASSLAEGIYYLLGGNVQVDDTVDAGVIVTAVHSALTTTGGGWPLHTDNWYRLVVGPGETLSQITFSIVDTNLPGPFHDFEGFYHVYSVNLIGDDPTPVLPLRFIEPGQGLGLGNFLHAQSFDGDWEPALPAGFPYEVDESFFG